MSTARRGFSEDTQKSFGYLLRDTSRRILQLTTDGLGQHGITLPQYFALRELWQRDGCTQRELANAVGILEPTMVATIDALEAAGLVARSRSTSDRRKTHVMLTERGHALRADALGLAAHVLEIALDGVTDEEIDQVRGVLQRVKQNLAQPAVVAGVAR